MDRKVVKQIRARLDSGERILITSHVRPDGDAVCSVLALGLALKELGKQVQMVLADGVPSDYHHLQHVEQIASRAIPPVDLVVTLDAAADDRSGDALRGFDGIDINIDHHITNTRFAALNFVDPAAVATCAILAELFPELGLQFTPAILDALLTGILTDTLGFRTSNMNPKALRIAADMVEKGADLPALYERALLRRSFTALRYWGAGLSKLQREGDLVWTSLSLADRKAADYPSNDDAELINNIAIVEGASVVLLFIEQHDNQVKISWRSQGAVDVSQIAAQFGGGGHVAAAGAVLAGSLDEVEQRVLQATRATLQGVPA
ncbi:MAG TPA: DHH family phosphoesterase [Anaerolineales bacterium]|nr:DHH family phosphoesterase [Anaerolineales bacterium]